MNLKEALINHVLEDVFSFIEREEFVFKTLEYLETKPDDEKETLYVPIYSALFHSLNKENFPCLLSKINNNYIFQIDLDKDGIWILSSLDNDYNIFCSIDEKQTICSTKQCAQFLLFWENLIDLGWSWKDNNKPSQKMIDLLENNLEK